LRAGDRLAVQLANRIEFIDLFLACLDLGVVLVPVNVLYREREVGHIVGDAEPRAVVTTRDLAGLVPASTAVWDVEELAAEVAPVSRERAGASASASRQMEGVPPCPVVGSDAEDATHPGEPRPVQGATAAGTDLDAGRCSAMEVTSPDPTTPALLVYTSGTTGRAKGAVLTHANLAANARNLLAAWRITGADRYLAVLPLFHVHGLGNGLCSWLASGCRMRLVPRFEHEGAEALFEEFRPTLFFGVPTIYSRLLEWSDEAARRVGSRTRLFVSGSAPLPDHVFEAFRKKFGHAILERYGMTETLMTLGNPYDGERRPGTVGRPFPGVEARIVDGRGRDVAEGEVGELLVRGPAVFSGYWRRPEATAEAFVSGWFRTGDLAERSADGYHALRGRASDVIITGGFNVYPREIEEVLLEQPGVREAAVLGAPDERKGEVPVACVVGDADPVALEAACRRQLASFKVPRSFVRVDALPRNALGKVQKHLLRRSVDPPGGHRD